MLFLFVLLEFGTVYIIPTSSCECFLSWVHIACTLPAGIPISRSGVDLFVPPVSWGPRSVSSLGHAPCPKVL